MYGVLVSCLPDKSDKEKYMFPAHIFQEGWQNILAGFNGAIYSTLTSPTLLRVAQVALKVAISTAFRERSSFCPPDGLFFV